MGNFDLSKLNRFFVKLLILSVPLRLSTPPKPQTRIDQATTKMALASLFFSDSPVLDLQNLGLFQQYARDEVEEFLYYLTKIADDATARKFTRDKFIGYKSNGDLVKLKYDARCFFTETFQFACRGVLYDLSTGKFYHPAVKFFNVIEYENRYEMSFEMFLRGAGRYEVVATYKADGTNVMTPVLNGDVRAFTLGTTDEFVMQPAVAPTTFSQGFFELLDPRVIEVLKKYPHYTATWEMMHKLNPIVTKYNRPHVQFLFATNEHGATINDEIFEKELINAGAEIVARRVIKTAAIDQMKAEIDSFKEEIKADTEKYGEHPEGLVYYARYTRDHVTYMIPVAKDKFDDYLALHGMATLQIGGAKRNCVIEHLVAEGKDDDLTVDVEIKHAKHFRTFITEVAGFLDCSAEALLEEINNPREYAVIAKEIGAGFPWLQTALFNKQIKDIIAGYTDETDFNSWQLITHWMLLENKGSTNLATLQKQNKETLDGTIYWFDQIERESVVKIALNKHKKSSTAVTGRKIALVDFDGTLHDTKTKPANWVSDADGNCDWWQSADSIDGGVNSRIVNYVHALQDAGFEIFILTGRQRHLEEKINNVVRKIGISATVLCAPRRSVATGHAINRNTSTTKFKTFIVGAFAQFSEQGVVDYCVHIDDDIAVLNACSIPFSCKFVQVHSAQIDDIAVPMMFTHHDDGQVWLLCGPQGMGKSSVGLRVAELVRERYNRTVTIVNMDRIRYEKADELGVVVTAKEIRDANNELFTRCMKRVENAYEQGHIVLLDMMNGSNSNFKYLTKRGIKNIHLIDWMPRSEYKSKKGDAIVSLDPAAVCFAARNVLNRTLENSDGSTFIVSAGDQDTRIKFALTTVAKMGQSCINYAATCPNVEHIDIGLDNFVGIADSGENLGPSLDLVKKWLKNRVYTSGSTNTTLAEVHAAVHLIAKAYDGVIPTVDSIATRVMYKIAENFSNSTDAIAPNNNYIGVIVPKDVMTFYENVIAVPDGHIHTYIPHITLWSPGKIPADYTKYVGVKVNFEVVGAVADPRAVALKIALHNHTWSDAEHPHITIAFAEGNNPSVASDVIANSKCMEVVKKTFTGVIGLL